MTSERPEAVTAEPAARITGKVVALEAPLISRLSQRPCVYWDVRQGLKEQPREVGKQSFWLEADSVRVLVIPDHIRVDARAERQKQLLAVAEADIAALAARLREVKAQLREQHGSAAAELRRERQHLAMVATFLHATRAHARGRVHLAGSARAQEAWLHEHAAAATSGPGATTATMTLDAWEVVIEEGQRVTVEGPCRSEAIAPELGSGDGYRSRLTASVMRGSDGSPLIVTGVGGIAPQAPTTEPALRVRGVPRPTSSARLKTLLALGFLVAILVAALLAGGRI